MGHTNQHKSLQQQVLSLLPWEMHQNRPEEITVMINIRLKRYIIATYCETHKTMNTSSKYFYEMLLRDKEIPNKEWENL